MKEIEITILLVQSLAFLSFVYEQERERERERSNLLSSLLSLLELEGV